MVKTMPDSLAKSDSSFLAVMAWARDIQDRHPFFKINERPAYPAYTKKRAAPGKELYFYLLLGMLFLFAIIKSAFEKYFSDLIKLFFRRSLKQRQLKKQLAQNSLPALLFNIFFVVTFGFYAAFAIQKTTPTNPFPFWQLLLCTTGAIGSIYIIKYLILKSIGWIFKTVTLVEDYIFLIFLVNKILAVFLLPLTIFITLTNEESSTIGWTLSWILISAFILYRYFAAVSLVRKEKGLNLFNFILYIAAFEVLPTIVLYKGIEALLK
ncbi:DUF4271 domain-containing protein [Niabella insulamsoli]|uniref:DUF4271 domain-containing protein n=1 Tax=Niabella insulamsoli TaxID=3144874 RepID=UPI0031FE3DB5